MSHLNHALENFIVHRFRYSSINTNAVSKHDLAVMSNSALKCMNPWKTSGIEDEAISLWPRKASSSDPQILIGY